MSTDELFKPWESSYNEQRHGRLSNAFYDYIDHDEAEAFLADLLKMIDDDKDYHQKKIMMLEALTERIRP